MSRKLIFLDIDGTLTMGGGNQPAESDLSAIRTARERGHLVFLCTGRNYVMLAPLLRFGFDGYIGSAGGYIVCGGQVIYDCPMRLEQVRTVLALLHRNGVYCTLGTRDASFGDERLGSGDNGIIRWRQALFQRMSIRPMAEYRGEPVYQIGFMCAEAGQLEEARAALGKDFVFVAYHNPARSFLSGDLINRAFDKGRGVRRVCEYYGADPADTIGFGDSMNDLEMLQTVGTGVAMRHADPELRKRCQRICAAAEDGGLGRTLLELIGGE